MLLISLSLVVISLPLSSILQGSMHAQRPVASHRVRLLVFLIQLGLDRNQLYNDLVRRPKRRRSRSVGAFSSSLGNALTTTTTTRRASLRQQIHDKHHHNWTSLAAVPHASTHMLH